MTRSPAHLSDYPLKSDRPATFWADVVYAPSRNETPSVKRCGLPKPQTRKPVRLMSVLQNAQPLDNHCSDLVG